MVALPIEPVLPAIRAALAEVGLAVLQAPPGAGKTTRVPLALLDQPWLGNRRVVVLEPRRLAARAAARRMAAMLGEEVGATVGYRVRFDSRVGPGTRIEVVTDGLFLRRLQEDPTLADIGVVLFDEFHERRLDADLALALVLEARAAFREDLRLLVMSATLDGEPVSALLGGAPMITSEGQAFPVVTQYTPPTPGTRIEEAMAAAIRRALVEEEGDILAFLPGGAEIRRTGTRLADLVSERLLIAPLHGDLGLDQQDQAIRPSPPGRRKVVLATALAETSLTIEGVRVVIDSGLMRVSRFDPVGGMSRLDTIRVSRAAADQRRGRAGRTQPGLCYRLWPEAEQRALLPFTPPEILSADLAPLALEVAEWGVADVGGLAWLDPPPPPVLAQARALLRQLGALDENGTLTRHGRDLAGFGIHPRLAHMMVRGQALGRGPLACVLAAVLGERDMIRSKPGQGGPGGGTRDVDLRRRVELVMAGGGPGADPAALQRVRHAAAQWARQMRVPKGSFGSTLKLDAMTLQPAATGALVALAYPDRIAQRRSASGGEGHYRLAQGRGAVLPPGDPLAAEPWLAVAELDGDRREARIFLAAPVTQAELELEYEALIETAEEVVWEPREQAVTARRCRRLGALVLASESLKTPDPTRLVTAMLDGVRHHGLALLPWTDAIESWRARLAFLSRVEHPERRANTGQEGGSGWPDLSDAVLLATLEEWLTPHLAGCTRAAHLKRLDLQAILEARLDWRQRRLLDDWAPSHLTVPSGSRLPLDYSGPCPILAVRLQEMFGARETPAICGGTVPVLLHLLSPAHRPVQVTRDLAGFWAGGYHQVKADLKGRYPKHAWPEDPLTAAPTNRTKRAMMAAS
jgi:ATP-dependent helicase HrpB